MGNFGQFYLDKEKDIVVELELNGSELEYTLRTPHHHTGNLITNLARLCRLPVDKDREDLKIIRGTVPCYVDGYNQRLYIFRLGGTKIANIYPDGRIEMKASVPAISKTLMSQTKDYRLNVAKTIVKTYIRRECKFETDLHTHMNGNLMPEVLIALGIRHQICYPLYYIKKLSLRCTEAQRIALDAQRERVRAGFSGSALTGKYLDRRIDDHTFINFADLILNDPEDAAYNIERIATSLSVPKDGQAVFADLEKTYLYRYVFTKGRPHPQKLNIKSVDWLPNQTVANVLKQMLRDSEDPVYADNTVFEDKLLWIARQYQSKGIRYAEITDTALTKPEDSVRMLCQVHRVMPSVTRQTGVTLRFLAGIRRIPLTIVRDQHTPDDYLASSLSVIKAVAEDPYVAGADIIGEEINDIMELREAIRQLVELADTIPDFVIRIHAGESDSLRDNVANSLKCVRDALKPGQPMPQLRIGHGLYTCNLRSAKGERLLRDLRESGAILEFQITSNVRLNNLSSLAHHPLKTYLHAGVRCVQGTDGAALYGTDSIDEELSLEKLLGLRYDELCAMRQADALALEHGMAAFQRKQDALNSAGIRDIASWLAGRIGQMNGPTEALAQADLRLEASAELAGQIESMPINRFPIVLAGGSFYNSAHQTKLRDEDKALIDRLLDTADPEVVIFVIGHRMTGYEAYLVHQNRGRFPIHAIVPTKLTAQEAKRLKNSGVTVSIAIESSGLGLYKSFAYEIFKHSPSLLLAFDGNAAAANLIQEAKNGRYKSRIFVERRSRDLYRKAQSLKGYVHFLDEWDAILQYVPMKKTPR